MHTLKSLQVASLIKMKKGKTVGRKTKCREISPSVRNQRQEMRQEERAECNGNSILVLLYIKHNWYFSPHKRWAAVKDTI